MIIGVDRSHHNEPIPLKQLTAKGIKFIFFKCCQGTTIKDSAFETSWKEAKSMPGLFRGGYHFFDPRLDGVAQANYFLSMNINFLA